MLAQKPPMGWNTWNTFAQNINEQLIMETADALVEKGYKDAGYEYVVIDDCWSLKERDENGRIVCDSAKFPHGMKYLADYIHSKGLKFGMYSCSGTLTCAGYPSSYNHEFEDAQTFADWGVDYLKYDYCYFPVEGNCRDAYTKMSMALKATGRDILFAACNWGEQDAWTWMRSRGVHIYRSTGDIFDNYKSFVDICDSQIDNLSMSAPGCFNDPDMLIVGMHGKGNVGMENGCTDNEYKMHFALWCMMSAPLMIGGDIRNLSEESANLLKNPGLIAIDQDEEARPPYRISQQEIKWKLITVFVKHLSNKEFMFAAFNFGDKKDTAHILFNGAGLPDTSGYCFELENAITGEKIGKKRDLYSCELDSHDCVVLRAKIVKI